MKLYQGSIEFEPRLQDTKTLQQLAQEVADELNRRQAIRLYDTKASLSYWCDVLQREGLLAAIGQYRRVMDVSLAEAHKFFQSL